MTKKLVLAVLIFMAIVIFVPDLFAIKIGEMVETTQQVRLKPGYNSLDEILTTTCVLEKGEQLIVRDISGDTYLGMRVFNLEKPGCSGWTTSNQVRRVP